MGSTLGIIGKNTFVSSVGSKSLDVPRELNERLKVLAARYPKKKSAIMPALYMVQEHFGWVSKEAVKWVSEQLSIPHAHVESVATFYTMYYKRPVGAYHVQVCRTLSCMLCGAKDISNFLKERLGITPGEVSKDGLWSWEEVECLGSCGTAPMVEINDVFFENLTTQSLGELMDKIEKEHPDLRFHTASLVSKVSDNSLVDSSLGEGLSEYGRSQVWDKNSKIN